MQLPIRCLPASRVLMAACAMALLAGALPTAAGAACPINPASSVFAAFGDSAAYSLAPGGSFESGATGWSLANTAVTGGNESFNVVAGSHSLTIAPAGVAVSPSVCIGSEYPTFRFFARRVSGGAGTSLSASLRWVNILGLTVDTYAGSVRSGSAWDASPVMKLGDSLPLWLPGSTLNVNLVFRSIGDGSWAIDDVFIDPYRR